MVRLPHRRTLCLAAVCLGGALLCHPVWAADAPSWPQFHGPRRDNISTEAGLLEKWPEKGPPLLWMATGIGHGYSTVAVSDGLVYTTGNVGQQTVITALDLDGKVQWTAPNGPAYDRSQPGTRSTPTVDEGRLYHENADGDVVCLEARTGKPIWHVNILERFKGRNISWGLAESLLIDGGNLICTPGGEEVGLAALDKRNGETVWVARGTGDKPGYGSPTVFDYKGLRQIVTLMTESVVSVEARTGRLLWKVPHKTPYDENITSPVYHDGHVFVTTRTTGGRLLKLQVEGEKCSVREVWANDTLDNQHDGVLLFDGHLYGSAYTTSHGPWVCVEFATGRKTAGDPGIGRCAFTRADGMLYALNHGGTVALVKAFPRSFEIVSRFEIPRGGDGPSWAHPVVCGGRLYIRHDDSLFCYAVQR